MTPRQCPASVKVLADSPLEAMWTYYRGLEAPGATRALVGDGVPAENLSAARDAIRQARAYFAAARTSPLLTRPVLDYYGMVSLGKLVLLLDRTNPVTLAGIEELERRGHGLKEYDGVSSEGEFMLETCEIEITGDPKAGSAKPRGVFPVLAATLVGEGASAWLTKRVSMLTLFRSIPQLETTLSEVLGPDCTYLGCSVQYLTRGDGRADLIAEILSPADCTPEEVLSRAPYLAPLGASLTQDTPQNDQARVRITFPEPGAAYEVALREEFARHAYALPPHLERVRLDSLLASYMLMYGLSIVARYKPHRWAKILDGHGSALLPAIESYLSVTERWWPNLILNHLTGKWVRFSQPSYW